MNAPLKIVYFGTSRFAVPPLAALLAAPELFQVRAVVTQPDRPVGRHGEIAASPVALYARAHELPLLQPVKLRQDELIRQQLSGYGADFFVVAAYGQILPREVLDQPRLGCVNLHGSILPHYRGASPIQAVILAGELKTGVSLMAMDEQMDHGDVYSVTELPIATADTFFTVEGKLAELAAEQLRRDLPLIAQGQLSAAPQDHAAATFTKIIKKEDGGARWSTEDAALIVRKLRAYDPWPGVHFIWQRGDRPLRIKILSATATGDANHSPGTVSRAASGLPLIATVAGSLELLQLQVEGKPPASGLAFLNGYPDFLGAKLA